MPRKYTRRSADNSGGASDLAEARLRSAASRDRELLSLSEAAARARCSQESVLNAVARGDLADVRDDFGRRCFDPAALDAWARARRLVLET